MLDAHQTPGFREYLETHSAQSAPKWLRTELAATRWPDTALPTAQTFAGLHAVLEAAAVRDADRQAG